MLCILVLLFFTAATMWKLVSVIQRNNCVTKIERNQIVVITGCDTGIGFELAKRVLNWGYHVVACCLRLDSKGATHLQHQNADVLQLDVTDEKLVKGLLFRIRNLQCQKKELHCLVNNAGVMTYGQTEWHTWALVENQLSVNLLGTIQVTRALLPLLRRNKGRIINVSSPQGLIGSPYMSIYCSSKWGIEGFSQALRREISKYDVKVIIVRPCNLPHKTSILRANREHLKSMWRNMDQEAMEEFRQEYETMVRGFETGFSYAEEPVTLTDPKLFEAFRLAVSSPNPQISYTAAPLVVTLFFNLLQLLPVKWTDALIRYNVDTAVLYWARD